MGATVVRNPAAGMRNSLIRWGVEPGLKIGGAEVSGPAAFSYVLGLEVDDRGCIYVPDGHQSEVRVLGSTGAYARSIWHNSLKRWASSAEYRRCAS